MMETKKIVINCGDEYRAKIEKKFGKEQFFYESYKRAAKCVSEIVNDRFDYMKTYDGQNNGRAFCDYGNNIVAFCAERGQGKTSAMLSFSKELKRYAAYHDSNELGFEFKNNECVFEVLESIDPTMIHNGVGILKVFLSRLFYHFKASIDKKLRDNTQYESLDKYNKMISCFKKCYTNIEYLSNDLNSDWDLDDLDMLSQIVDSSNLKSNIYDLLKLYFKIKYDEDIEKCFLVIQIDDADLAIGEVSDICENIRNYLKVPGIIVLIATDYEQLKYAMSQKYQEQYGNLIKNNPSFYEKCEKMASKYLKKIIPHSHRIELPKLQNVIGEEHIKLKVEYGIGSKNLFPNELNGCNDIQEQLIKFIYLRTGIILMKNEDKMHPFLPCRLRELTHLIKLLSDMEPVNYNCIFELPQGDKKHLKMIAMLQRNLQMFKSYFISDWCFNRLSQSEQELIYKINEIKINESIEGDEDPQIYRTLSEYIENEKTTKEDKSDKAEKTHKCIINELIINKLSDRPELQSALLLYFSIYLNIRFAYAFENEVEHQRILAWLDNPIEVPECVRKNKYGKKYRFLYFEFDYKRVKEKINEDEGSGLKRKWLELFCRAKPEENFNAPKSLFVSAREDKEVFVYNEELTRAEFDLLQPLNAIFYNGYSQEWRKEVSKYLLQPQDSLGDVVPGKGEAVERENMEIAAVLRSVKNIIANYDVQRYLMGFIEREYRYVHLRNNIISWRTTCLDVYKGLDEKYKQVFGFLGVECNLHTIFDKFFKLPKVNAVVFLSNSVNRTEYLMQYKEQLENACNTVIQLINRVEEYSLDEFEDFILDTVINKTDNEYLIKLNILGNRSEVATIDESVSELWSIECSVNEIYDSVLSIPMKSYDEFEKLKYGVSECNNKLQSIDLK